MLKLILFPKVALAVYCAIIRGAPKVFSSGRIPKQLYKAKQIGTIPIGFARKKMSVNNR